MKKLALYSLLLLISGAAFAQNYIKRTAEEPVYDIEVIVFGRYLAQPAVESIQQAVVYDQQAAVEVNFLPPNEDWPIIKSPPQKPDNNQSQKNADNRTPENQTDQSGWEVPLNEKPIDYEVLVWYLKSQQLIGSVVNLLDSNPKYKPLIRQVWRQPATPFTQPLYVKVNSPYQDAVANSEDKNTDQENRFDFTFNATDKPTFQDFQIDGQVALSQGRFTHLHIKFNYYRINESNDVLIYGSKQQRQIKLDQWQYFDHPQFGVLIKVTAVKAEELL